MSLNPSKFSRELAAAGLTGLPFGFSDDGTLHFSQGITQEQRDAIEALKAAHDPTPDPTDDRLADRADALSSLLESEPAATALDAFLRSIKARPDLPEPVRRYIQKHKL